LVWGKTDQTALLTYFPGESGTGNSHTRKHCPEIPKKFKIIFWIQILFYLLNDNGLQKITKCYELESITIPSNISATLSEISFELHLLRQLLER
jgi:hypothetical protein